MAIGEEPKDKTVYIVGLGYTCFHLAKVERVENVEELKVERLRR